METIWFLLFFVAALQSVFPQSELGTFMALTREDKEKQLKELSYIVTGIRLFNRDCGKGGEGIDDCKWRARERIILILKSVHVKVWNFIFCFLVPEILKDALKVTNNNLETELKKALKMSFQFTGR